MQNPVRGLMNAVAAGAAAVGTATLMWRSPGWSGRIALIVFGVGLIALFTTSSLYHSIPWRESWYRRMQRLDHSMIFVLIAASYTPIGVIVLGGWLRWATIGVAWGIAFTGIGLVLVLPRSKHGISIALMMVLGWISLPLMVPVATHAGGMAVAFLALGGILYSVGMVFLVTGRPRLWPRVFSHHELFHVFVIGAAAFHFAANFGYVAPLA
jgi:hemolysin III